MQNYYLDIGVSIKKKIIEPQFFFTITVLHSVFYETKVGKIGRK